MTFFDGIFQMKGRSWKTEYVMSPYSSSGMSSPRVLWNDSSCHTWYGYGYESNDLYKEHNSSGQDFFPDLYSRACCWDDEIYEREVADPICQDLGLIYGGSSGNWLGEYISKFADCWREDMFSEGYDESNNIYNGLEMIEDSHGDKWSASNDCSDNETERLLGTEHYPWFGSDFGFQYGVDEDHDDCGVGQHNLGYSQSWSSWDEMELYEKIFGHCPCLLAPDMESSAETGLA